MFTNFSCRFNFTKHIRKTIHIRLRDSQSAIEIFQDIIQQGGIKKFTSFKIPNGDFANTTIICECR